MTNEEKRIYAYAVRCYENKTSADVYLKQTCLGVEALAVEERYALLGLFGTMSQAQTARSKMLAKALKNVTESTC